jgi:hypothetical protein
VIEHEAEPIRGLPERLPKGETILWQGAPGWWSLALRALHVRLVLFYFAGLFVWSVGMGVWDGAALGESILVALRLLPVALVAVGFLSFYAWLVQRTTVYTITNKRVVMRFGTALPMALNLPFAKIESAALKLHGDGTGDIPLTLMPSEKASYYLLWPHARPWRVSKAEPMLRAVPDAAHASRVLAQALANATGGQAHAIEETETETQSDVAGSRQPVAA